MMNDIEFYGRNRNSKLGLLAFLPIAMGETFTPREPRKSGYNPRGLTGKQWTKRKSKMKITKASKKKNRKKR